MKCWRRMLLIGVCGLATAAAGILPRTTLAQMLPFEHYKVEPIDARQAFVEGYRAYQNREWPSVIERMELAVVQVPDLIDYALFFQARAQQRIGSLNDLQGLSEVVSQHAYNRCLKFLRHQSF